MTDAPISIGGQRPLSPAQKPIWRAETLYRGTSRWTQVTAVLLQGHIDVARMAKAFEVVVARHPALRTRIHRRARRAWQSFSSEWEPLAIHRPPLPENGEPDDRLDQFLQAACAYRFPLYDAPLVHGSLVCLGPTSSALILSLHHIAADGIASVRFIPQIAAVYRGDDACSNIDHAYENWLDRQEEQSEALATQAASRFYTQLLDHAPPPAIHLYDGRPNAPHTPPNLLRTTHTLSANTRAAINDLAKANRATPFLVLLAAYASALAQTAEITDLLVTAFVSGRQHEPTPIVGNCINTALVRITIEPRQPAKEAIAATLQAWRLVRPHQAVPADDIRIQQNGNMPLPQFAINYLDLRDILFAVPDVQSSITHIQQGYPLNDVLFYALREQDNCLRLQIISGSGDSRITTATLERIMRSLVDILHGWTMFEASPVL